jgi:hypothetical protein
MEHARLLLQHGYSVLMMDLRARRERRGQGQLRWLERKDGARKSMN